MAYDRYDTRSDRERWRGSDRGREHDRWRGSDHDRGGGREERGFFERAGDEIASWFGGDDDRDSGRRHDERMSRGRGPSSGRDDRFNFGGWGSDSERERHGGSGRDWNRGRFEEDERSSFRPANWASSDRDYRSGGGGGQDFGGRGGGWAGAFTGSDYDRRESGRSYRPMTGDYGRSEDQWGGGYDRSQTPWGRDDYRRTSFAGAGRDNDRHYQAWRDRQLSELDRDYDQYCRERQDRFETDFGGWRNQRMQKRQHLGSIQEQMEVVGSDGTSIGTVDRVSGDRIVLAKSGADDNRHHAIDCSMIDTVEGGQVRLTMPAEEAKSRWEDAEGGTFGRNHEGDTNLERSFSGTYR